MKKFFLFSILFLGTVLFSGCGKQDPAEKNNNPETSPVSEVKPEVAINNFSFTPGTLEIKVGDTVTWSNQDNAPHQVVADSTNDLPNPASTVLNQGDKFAFTFSKAGIFHYHCSIHPSMKGIIIVK